MASITINNVTKPILPSTTITGDEKLITIGLNGRPSTISFNQLLDKVDDDMADRVEDQVKDQIIEHMEDQIDDIIDDRLENLDPEFSLKWNEIQ
jgi:hypothetical protein